MAKISSTKNVFYNTRHARIHFLRKIIYLKIHHKYYIPTHSEHKLYYIHYQYLFINIEFNVKSKAN